MLIGTVIYEWLIANDKFPIFRGCPISFRELLFSLSRVTITTLRAKDRKEILFVDRGMDAKERKKEARCNELSSVPLAGLALSTYRVLSKGINRRAYGWWNERITIAFRWSNGAFCGRNRWSLHWMQYTVLMRDKWDECLSVWQVTDSNESLEIKGCNVVRVRKWLKLQKSLLTKEINDVKLFEQVHTKLIHNVIKLRNSVSQLILIYSDGNCKKVQISFWNIIISMWEKV